MVMTNLAQESNALGRSVSRCRIALFHIGNETIYPTVMVRSIRAHNPEAWIVQCTDHFSPSVIGVDEVVRNGGDNGLPMRFRLESFARLDISAPTLFLDTDMICVQPLDPAEALQGQDAAVCLREYGREILLDPNAMNIDLSEYSGRRLGDIGLHPVPKTPS